MKKIKIPTRKKSSYEEWSALRELLQKKDTFYSDQGVDFINKLIGREITQQRFNTMMYALVKRKGAVKAVGPPKPGHGKFQKYQVIHKDLHVTPPKSIDSKQKKLPMEDNKQKPVEKEILTLADVERINEMDLAFIGYTIRTEAEILSKKYEVSLIQVKKAQEELLKLNKQMEEMKKDHMVEIQTLVKHHKQEVESFKKKLQGRTDHEQTIRNLNNRITNLNMINENLKKDVERLEKIVGKAQREDKTFKLGEVAKFTNGKPSHLS